ncbi:oxygen-independent coproporphyrinogen III oxidase [Loktanella sp. SALINAS62]|uniref:oxygen-independent coproporphyrinogen III oxidase n=1 Tax=Loktanella sp. SALINAS62 TaxID=2706124 RepID=UPI001B8AB031|nr:oxygen-independent coproporphyrinogen III oxidase [Loktanella sp. SALINAS62]MBS1301180.1 oxygen-independent coproporphyrinogen III oxidase [Loktanella sp. SALINAS62]
MTHLEPYHAARAPRYTSYPPATQFTDRIGPDVASGWLQQVAPGASISLYVHIPFCRRLCWFCACRTQGTRSDAPLLPYLDTLDAEIAQVSALLPDDVQVSQIHLGGGTPTLLPPDLLGRLFDMLDRRFTRRSDAEISVEVDPTEIDDPRLDALAAAGVTRASLGVQDFHSDVQAAIGRPQSVAQTRAAIDGLRARGVRGINLDLLYGLPRQTVSTLDETLDIVTTLSPDRIALYGYAHVPWASRRQTMIRDADLPGARTRLAMAARASAHLQKAGYDPIGFDHFARPGDAMVRAAKSGTLRRNFQGYTVDPSDVLIGLGASSISLLPGGYAQNAPRTGDWATRVRAGRLPTTRGHALTADDRLHGAVIERLLCDFAINPDMFSNPAAVRAMTHRMAINWPDAVLRTPGGDLQVAVDARHLVRLIAMEIDQYAAPEGRHSLVV